MCPTSRSLRFNATAYISRAPGTLATQRHMTHEYELSAYWRIDTIVCAAHLIGIVGKSIILIDYQ